MEHTPIPEDLGYFCRKWPHQWKLLPDDLDRLFRAAPGLADALIRMVGSCTRFLGERNPTDAQLADPNYVSELQQARAALKDAGLEE